MVHRRGEAVTDRVGVITTLHFDQICEIGGNVNLGDNIRMSLTPTSWP